MVSSNPLCEYCSRIPFDPATLRDHHDRFYALGTAGRIRRSVCPFCKLVSLLMYEESKGIFPEPVPSRTPVSIRWDNSVGPAGGFKFIGYGGDIGICFMSSEQNSYDVDRAYCMTPGNGQVVDSQRVRGWVARCAAEHGGDCARIGFNEQDDRISANYPGLKVLRLIDVQNCCIVETSVVRRYVTLSYVWGMVPNFRLTTSNLADLKKPRALLKYWNLVARTVRDAINFVEDIGERYLWVDALCLLQNNAEDTNMGINTMDVIYEKALLTIVAACGFDANYGLPGVREGTRFPRMHPEFVAPGVQLDVYVALEQRMKESVYSSRAWTFQEDVLSRRTVYFVDNEVYFRCRSTTLFEFWVPQLDGSRERPTDCISSLLPRAVHMDDPINDLEILLLYYSRRALTYQLDAPNAMAGIIRRLSERMKCRFFEGLPTAAFDMFVLFRPHHSLLHRRPGLPSYSWTGWRGPLKVMSCGEIAVNQWLSGKTWIIWHKRSPRGIISPIWDRLSNDQFPFNDLDYVGYRHRSAFRPPAELGFPTRRTQPSEDIDPTSLHSYDYPLLQFWTLSAFFNINVFDKIAGGAMILDRNGDTCGAFYPDGLEETDFFGSLGPFEFIALSETKISDWTYHDMTLKGKLFPGWKGPSECKVSRKMSAEGACYNVMALEWSGPVAERRGLGFVLTDSILEGVSPGPSWKEIVLA